MSTTQKVAYYRPCVRIGNWFEDICLEEDKIKNLLKKRKNSELLLQKFRVLFLNFHTQIVSDAPSDYICFGSVVQIISCCLNICDDKSKKKSALSVVINERVVRNSQKINDQCELTVAQSTHPCVRNSFKVVSGDEKDRTNEPLKYGQHFAMECVDAVEQPLVLCSLQKSADLTTMVKTTFDSKKQGEINLPVALCLKRNTGAGKAIPSAYTWWRCYQLDPGMRLETDGQPIPSNCPLVINHSATNRNLAAENVVVETLFGPEYLVSVQNYEDIFKKPSLQNTWIIAIGNEHKLSGDQ